VGALDEDEGDGWLSDLPFPSSGRPLVRSVGREKRAINLTARPTRRQLCEERAGDNRGRMEGAAIFQHTAR